ncbi:hypothetical protein N431DRAFT_425091 [Stipitochalara longipes BDJ]|nr:hypothetical protein N431DRAFT_425091 [Stipitochalara longipes BDJ]
MASYREFRIDGDSLNNTLSNVMLLILYGASASSVPRHAKANIESRDRKVRDWLVGKYEALGCDMKVDQMGNMFAHRPCHLEGLGQPPSYSARR